MAGQRGGGVDRRRLLVAACSLVILLWRAISIVDAQSDACGSDLSAFLPSPFNASTLACKPVWNNFVLRYSQSQDNILSIVLSATYTSGWVAIGFSKDGMMVGSSAMVGWVGRDSRTHLRQYYLGAQTPSQVTLNDNNLQTTDVTPVVTLFGPNIYLAFQLKFPATVKQQNLLFAFSSATPINYVLQEHDDKISILFDFSSGISSASSYPSQLKRNHGILNILAWGVLLPIGSIIARYCKQWDPLWFYLHVGIQFAGFIIGLSGVVAGIALYDKLHANVQSHRGLGIFVFVLGILQVLAFFLRPDKDSKYRKYWNWYHHWVGRLLLLLAAINIFVGIGAGGAGSSWRVGYGVNLAVILAMAFGLEIMWRLRWSKKSTPALAF